MAVIVSNVSGTIADGGNVSITGSGFGTGPSNVEWLGGSGGNIESGTVGDPFSKSGWAIDSDFVIPLYSSTQKHSGSKSIYCGVEAGDYYNSIFKYLLSPALSSSGKLFVSYWVRMTPSAGKSWHQWKINRFSTNDTIVDGYNQLILFSWDDGEKGTQLCVDPNVVSYTNVGVTPVYTTSVWQRIDIWIEADVTNGTFTITQTVPGSSRVTDTVYPYPTHKSGSAWNYIIWQNYIGNNSAGSADIFYDDIYISNGSQARVEIGNAATYAACTHLEIQPSVSWASGAITATLNRGSFGVADSVYLYVIASDGTVNSAGKLITFGGTAVDITPNAFTFTDVTGATRSTQYTSSSITVSGLDSSASISITGGTYSKNGGSYTATAGTCVNGDVVTVRLTSSSSYSTAVSAALTIGTVSDTYSVTTAAAITSISVTASPIVISFSMETGITSSTSAAVYIVASPVVITLSSLGTMTGTSYISIVASPIVIIVFPYGDISTAAIVISNDWSDYKGEGPWTVGSVKNQDNSPYNCWYKGVYTPDPVWEI